MDTVAKLRHMGRQYANGQAARGGGQQKHYLEEAADEIDTLRAERLMQYRVHGYCLVPCEAEIVVDAGTPDEAMTIAMAAWQAEKSALIISNSADADSAYEWQPTAEPVEPNRRA